MSPWPLNFSWPVLSFSGAVSFCEAAHAGIQKACFPVSSISMEHALQPSCSYSEVELQVGYLSLYFIYLFLNRVLECSPGQSRMLAPPDLSRLGYSHRLEASPDKLAVNSLLIQIFRNEWLILWPLSGRAHHSTRDSLTEMDAALILAKAFLSVLFLPAPGASHRNGMVFKTPNGWPHPSKHSKETE